MTRCPSVHMVGMRYPIDVAVVDKDGIVLQVATLRPWTGMTRFRRKASATIEAAAGSMLARCIAKDDPQKYFAAIHTLFKQQETWAMGKTSEELDAQWYDPTYWTSLHGMDAEIDKLIEGFNERVGLLK